MSPFGGGETRPYSAAKRSSGSMAKPSSTSEGTLELEAVPHRGLAEASRVAKVEAVEPPALWLEEPILAHTHALEEVEFLSQVLFGGRGRKHLEGHIGLDDIRHLVVLGLDEFRQQDVRRFAPCTERNGLYARRSARDGIERGYVDLAGLTLEEIGDRDIDEPDQGLMPPRGGAHLIGDTAYEFPAIALAEPLFQYVHHPAFLACGDSPIPPCFHALCFPAFGPVSRNVRNSSQFMMAISLPAKSLTFRVNSTPMPFCRAQ